MRSTVFVLQFRGSAAPENDDGSKLTVRASAPSQSLATTISAAGVSSVSTPGDGSTASHESHVEMAEAGMFHERGTLTYGEAGSVSFETLGRGALFPPDDDGNAYGSVIFRVTSGSGVFEGASGTITSTFRVNGSGEVLDTQVANFNLPD